MKKTREIDLKGVRFQKKSAVTNVAQKLSAV